VSMAALLDGRAGLVTGAAQGIGRASALACAAHGGAVVVADLPAKEEQGRETVRLVEDAGGTARWQACDVTIEAQQRALVEAVVSAYGRLDFAHNNAGIVIKGMITEIEESDFDQVLAVNLKGILFGMKHQLRIMLEQPDPRTCAIVNTASLAGLIAAPSAGSYVASKHAVVGLTKTAAVEVADSGIRVNCVCPAAVRTPMLEAQPPDRIALLIAPQAIKRMADPGEVGEVVAFLLSERASFITGLALPIDGGALSF
jgi:NAD(P)-dependent dehydrogenase (short-subunit alcohol dehydrogenase family)